MLECDNHFHPLHSLSLTTQLSNKGSPPLSAAIKTNSKLFSFSGVSEISFVPKSYYENWD